VTTERAPESYLRLMPKVELHCHLEGSVPAATAVALARRNGTELPTMDPDTLYRFDDLEGFLDIYRAVSRAMVSAADFATVTYDSLVDAARTSNLRYREMAFNPTNHPGVPLADMLTGISEGIQSAERDCGVVGRIIVAFNREQPPELATELVRMVADADSPHVLGVGLDHNELSGPPQLFVDAYAIARAAGLARTAHAGERGNVAEVADTIGLLDVDRIDHGYAVLQSADLIRQSIDRGLHYAACWSTSAFHERGGQVSSPIAAMAAAGLDVSVSSDDPPFFATDIGSEYVQAGESIGWDRVQARQQVLRTAAATFLPPAEREALCARLAAEFDAYDET
jgi:adenosine deaminase